MRMRRREDGSISTSRLFSLKALLVLTLLSEFLLSFKLWGVSRHYPLTPVWGDLPEILLLVIIAVVRRPRWYIVSLSSPGC